MVNKRYLHPQNVRFQNVRFHNVRFQNVRFQNVRFTKRYIYKTSRFKTFGFQTSIETKASKRPVLTKRGVQLYAGPLALGEVGGSEVAQGARLRSRHRARHDHTVPDL
jgi:hypothetical protein